MNKKYFPTDSELQIIRDLYDGTTLRLGKIMRALGSKYPRWYVRRQAVVLGVARAKEPYWTAAEEAYVEDHYPRFGLKHIQRGLKSTLAVQRSINAIQVKIRRLGLHSASGEGFTLSGLCGFFWSGQENRKAIHRWMENGWLRGKRRGTLRTKEQGGDHWFFDPEWVRSFIIAHPEEIDLRLVDPVAFIRLVAGGGKVPTMCKCPGCGLIYETKTFNPGVRMLRIYCESCKGKVARTLAA